MTPAPEDPRQTAYRERRRVWTEPLIAAYMARAAEAEAAAHPPSDTTPVP